MRRKRRNRGMWLPVRGQFVGPDPETSNISSGFEISLTVPGPAAVPNVVTQIIPLTTDIPIDDDEIQGNSIRSMADIVGHDYFLKRIVGKLIVGRRNLGVANQFDQYPDCFEATVFGAGICVARANDSASGGGADTPTASATPAERNDNYSPLEADTIRNPWIWRRTWVLGTQGLAYTALCDPTAFRPAESAFPCSTALYGSVQDGPHIDAKTKRVVRHKDRLWLCLSAWSLSAGGAQPSADEAFLFGYFDYRLFGSLIRPRNRGNF